MTSFTCQNIPGYLYTILLCRSKVIHGIIAQKEGKSGDKAKYMYIRTMFYRYSTTESPVVVFSFFFMHSHLQHGVHRLDISHGKNVHVHMHHTCGCMSCNILSMDVYNIT